MFAQDNAMGDGDDREWPAMISEGCTEGSVGVACECVMHFNSKYFSSDGFMHLVQGLEWERPREVELFWKGEDDETYHRTSLFKWRHQNVECPLSGECINPDIEPGTNPLNHRESFAFDRRAQCSRCGGHLPRGFIPKKRTQ